MDATEAASGDGPAGTRVETAAGLLGWDGELHGPVRFGGVTFTAVVDPECEPGPPGGGWLVGCLVRGDDTQEALRDASLLAAYSPRAALVPEPDDPVDVRLQAALLDQGVVAEQPDGDQVLLSPPGEVVPSPLQLDDAWRTDPGWASLREAITTATDEQKDTTASDTSAGRAIADAELAVLDLKHRRAHHAGDDAELPDRQDPSPHAWRTESARDGTDGPDVSTVDY